MKTVPVLAYAPAYPPTPDVPPSQAGFHKTHLFFPLFFLLSLQDICSGIRALAKGLVMADDLFPAVSDPRGPGRKDNPHCLSPSPHGDDGNGTAYDDGFLQKPPIHL